MRSIIDQCYGTAKQILTDNRDKLDAMADALMKYETIDAEQIDDIMSGRDPRPPEGWSDADHSGGTPSPAKAKVIAPEPEPDGSGLTPASQH